MNKHTKETQRGLIKLGFDQYGAEHMALAVHYLAAMNQAHNLMQANCNCSGFNPQVEEVADALMNLRDAMQTKVHEKNPYIWIDLNSEPRGYAVEIRMNKNSEEGADKVAPRPYFPMNSFGGDCYGIDGTTDPLLEDE